MRMQVAALVWILAFISIALTQSKQPNIGTLSPTVKINTNKPSVFLTFESFGDWKPLRDDESNKGIWLRLHNNLRYSIRFCAFGITSDGVEMAFHGGSGDQLGATYDLIANAPEPGEKLKTSVEVPAGRPVGGLCHSKEVPAGDSVLFAVPREHLPYGVSLRMAFNYQWESSGELTHYVLFNSSQVPGVRRIK